MDNERIQCIIISFLGRSIAFLILSDPSVATLQLQVVAYSHFALEDENEMKPDQGARGRHREAETQNA